MRHTTQTSSETPQMKPVQRMFAYWNLGVGIQLGLLILGVLCPLVGFSQQVKDVPKAFESLGSEPEIIRLANEISVPSDGGHFQGVQVIYSDKKEKLLISGSSHTKAYVLQADLSTLKTDKLITLMEDPFRHAGGFQVSQNFLGVGIEDNLLKTFSKVCLFNYQDYHFYNAKPNLSIQREGAEKLQTAGAVGMVYLERNQYLMVVGNWDSRNWDFYSIDPEANNQKRLLRFDVPKDWADYQSINLMKDEKAIYAIGFYRNQMMGCADLILVSYLDKFEPIMKKVNTKTFNCKNGADFGSASGLQVDTKGSLHVWAVQSKTSKEIVVNKF